MPDPIVQKLSDVNYTDWRIKMEALLEEKELWDIVSGNETMPTTGPNSKATKAFLRKQRLARAKIILHVEDSQLPHTRYNDPKEIWDSLARVHRSRGFGTLLSMRRRFFSMTKQDSQPMQAWIASMRHAAFELEAADFVVRDINLIIALTQGLPESYSSVIVSLNATPPDQLKPDSVIIRLLNEETCQRGTTTTKPDPAPDNASDTAMYVGPSPKRPPRDQKELKRAADTRCYNCRGYGHIARECPSPKPMNFAGAVEDDDDDDVAF
jgi:hypothetical protein